MEVMCNETFAYYSASVKDVRRNGQKTLLVAYEGTFVCISRCENRCAISNYLCT